MKIFSPHRRKMEAKRRFGGKEFQNKIKKAQGYKRAMDSRQSLLGKIWHGFGIWGKLATTGSVLVILVVAYYSFISPYFLVTNVTVNGTSRVSAEDVANAIKDSSSSRSFFIPKNHLVFLSKGKAESLIIAKAPLVKEIGKYKRIWPNGLELEVVERNPGFILTVNGKDYLVDDQGIVLKEQLASSEFLHVIDDVVEGLTIGETLNNTKLIGFVMSLGRQWPIKINSNIREIKLPGKAATQLQAISDEGWGVFFDISRPVETQLVNLSTILSRQIPAKSRLNLAYIDLRFDKWAYYCYKDSPCEAQAQLPEENSGTGVEKVPVDESKIGPQTEGAKIEQKKSSP